MHKRVLNVLAISIRRAHRVFERNSKLHHWSNSGTLEKYNKSVEKPKALLSGTNLPLSGANLRLSGINLRQSPVNLVRALLSLRSCGNSPQQLEFDWIEMNCDESKYILQIRIFNRRFESSFED